MMQDLPLVSIIMPVYNAEKYVAFAIESVLSQTYTRWELLIIDDGSTDHSKQVIQKLEDSRIRYFYQENRGVSSARNVGLKNMKGKFICFLDADDELTAESIAARMVVFDGNPKVKMVDGYVQLYDAEMRTLLHLWKPSIRGNVLGCLLRLQDRCFFSASWLIKIVPGFNYVFDERMTHAEDLFFLTGVAETGDYDFINQTVYKYRASPHSAMRNLDGLGYGYWQFYNHVKRIYASKLGFFHPFLLLIKIRKIMFLSYLSNLEILKAGQYLFMGRTYGSKQIK
jgi:glycosyltransferase involved in cell wall biosynthesis